MGALDPAKILMILVIALIVLGPERLPKVAQQLGAAWREVIKFREKLEAEVRSAIPDVDLPRLPTRPGAAVATFLAGLTDTSKPLNGAASTANEGAPELVALDGTANDGAANDGTAGDDRADDGVADDGVAADAATMSATTTPALVPGDVGRAVNGESALAGGPEAASGAATVAESISANAERQMQQIAARRAAAMARAEGRGSVMATINAAKPAPAPVQVSSGLVEDSAIGFDDPSMN